MRVVVTSTVLLSLLTSNDAFALVPNKRNFGGSVTPIAKHWGSISSLLLTNINNNVPASSKASSSGTSLSASTLHDVDSLAQTHVSPENLALLSERGRTALLRLIANDAEFGANKHVYCDWPEAGVDDEKLDVELRAWVKKQIKEHNE